MNFLIWILLGLVAGAIAKWIHPGPDPGGWIVTILIGIVGAFVGGLVFVICLWAYRKFSGSRV